jgi:8-oxo-dGTP pyrophosphatase MutT (NUDIX family)
MIPTVGVSKEQLASWLLHRLSLPLPSFRAQREFTPALAYGRHHGPPAPGARQAAVVALLFPAEDGWRLPLILRPHSMRDHAGQVSLPGGAIDPGESSREAAVRELNEELGVDPSTIDVLGELSPVYVFVTRYLVAPLVAITDRRPEFHASPREVAELIEAPIERLAEPASRRRRAIVRRGLSFTTPEIVIGRHSIWGATNIILGELLSVLGEFA